MIEESPQRTGREVRLRGRDAEERLLADPGQRAVLERLVALAERLGLQPEHLDDLVHDLADEQATASVNAGEGVATGDFLEDADAVHDLLSQDASAINNGGLRSQIAFMVDQAGPEWAHAQLARSARTFDGRHDDRRAGGDR